MKKRSIWLLLMFLCAVLAVEAWSLSELQFKKQLPSTPKGESLTPGVSSKVPLERVPVKSKPVSLTGGELELLGTAMTNSKDPLAFIKDLKTGKQGVYRLGSLIKGAKIVGIARGNVLLEKNGQRELLGLTAKVTGSKPGLAIVTVSENQMRVNKTAALDEVVNQYDTLKLLKIKLYYVSDEVKGLMVDGIAKGSIIEAAGIRNKDIINTVNNQKIDSYQKALEVARKVRNQSEIKVNLLRDGAIRTLTYQIGK